MTTFENLGDRMKAYENAWRFELPRRVPIIIRVDGRAFHSLTSGMERPFDDYLMTTMARVAIALCEDVQGAQLAFVQSDEVSVLVHGYRTIQSEPWFDNGLQKIASVSAAVATRACNERWPYKLATFDARVFLMPEDEVCNYFLWRQQDATRNSIQMVAQTHFSAKELHGQDQSAMQEMLFQRMAINWNEYAARYRRGRCVVRRSPYEGARPEWVVDNAIPIFSQDREYVNRHVSIHREEAA